ncbi:MAG: radical SAM-associated putative lipoprotein [Bacteroidales bacterium]|nr:radical SAM-associated putative lipoprotein [Bacteroidales bacterium]
MKIKYLKLKNWLLVSLGGLLGISLTGCDKLPGGECEYGCPEGIYHVKGTVTNEKGEPIAGIGVGRKETVTVEEGLPAFKYLDTTGTDGRYDVSVYCFPSAEKDINFDDIDGEQHGAYRDTVIYVKSDNFHGGDGHWNQGTAEITQNVTMQSVKN